MWVCSFWLLLKQVTQVHANCMHLPFPSQNCGYVGTAVNLVNSPHLMPSYCEMLVFSVWGILPGGKLAIRSAECGRSCLRTVLAASGLCYLKFLRNWQVSRFLFPPAPEAFQSGELERSVLLTPACDNVASCCSPGTVVTGMLSKGKLSHILRWQLSFVQDAHVSGIMVKDCVGILLRLVHCTFFFFFWCCLNLVKFACACLCGVASCHCICSQIVLNGHCMRRKHFWKLLG